MYIHKTVDTHIDKISWFVLLVHSRCMTRRTKFVPTLGRQVLSTVVLYRILREKINLPPAMLVLVM